MTPMPPAWAMAMARRASVTVSMADEMIGRLRKCRASGRERMSTARHDVGMARTQQTSSKVRASNRIGAREKAVAIAKGGAGRIWSAPEAGAF